MPSFLKSARAALASKLKRPSKRPRLARPARTGGAPEQPLLPIQRVFVERETCLLDIAPTPVFEEPDTIYDFDSVITPTVTPLGLESRHPAHMSGWPPTLIAAEEAYSKPWSQVASAGLSWQTNNHHGAPVSSRDDRIPTPSNNIIGSEIVVRATTYTFLNRAGGGTYGQVYIVESVGFRTIHAIKVIPKSKRKLRISGTNELDGHASRDDLVKREVEALTAIRDAWSPNLIHTLDFGEDLNHSYIITDAHPMSLSQRLRMLAREDMPVPPEERQWYMQQLVQAVTTLHGLDYAHLDIKPGNVMIKANGYLCLIDFGCAVRGPTQTCGPWGTDEYAADETGISRPEDYGVKSFDPKMADVYSLGHTLMDVYLTPVRRRSPEFLMGRLRMEDRTTCSLIEIMTAQSVDARFTMEEVRKALSISDLDASRRQEQKLVAPFIPPSISLS